MTIEIIGKSSIKTDEITRNITNLFEQFEEVDSGSIIEILFVSNEEIRKINLTYRQKDEATDVLSFPQISIGGNKPILGSIVICEEIAKEKGESTTELLEHGFLHLLGFDHEENPKDWNKIERKLHGKI